MKELSKLLRDRCDIQTQVDFAKEIGVDPAALSRWMTGVLPSLESILRVSLGLGRDPREVIAASGEKAYVDLWDQLMVPKNEPSKDPLEEEMVYEMKRILTSKDKEAISLVSAVIRYVTTKVRRR